MKKKTVSETAQEIIEYWQPILRLQNWKITVTVVEDVKDIRCFATNTQDPHYEISSISVLNPEKIPPEWKGCKDLEVTIVHELMHTRLIYVAPRPKKNKRKSWQLEMAVETIAKALVASRRGVDPEDIK